MEELMYSFWSEYLLFPFLYALAMCVIARTAGIEINFSKKRTKTEIFKNCFVWFMIIFCNLFFIWLLLFQHEVWLMHQWGLEYKI